MSGRVRLCVLRWPGSVSPPSLAVSDSSVDTGGALSGMPQTMVKFGVLYIGCHFVLVMIVFVV